MLKMPLLLLDTNEWIIQMLKLPYSSVISVVVLMLFTVFVIGISQNLLGKNKE